MGCFHSLHSDVDLGLMAHLALPVGEVARFSGVGRDKVGVRSVTRGSVKFHLEIASAKVQRNADRSCSVQGDGTKAE